MKGKLPIISAGQRLSERRSIKVAIFGKSGAGVYGERCGCSHSVASASGCR